MVVISVMGIVLIVVGIMALIKNAKMRKIKTARGLVISTYKRDHKIKTSQIQYFESEIEFTNVYGSLQTSTVQGNQPLTVGTGVDVRFDRKKNKLYLENDLRKKGKPYGFAFIVMGIVLTALGVLLELGRIKDEAIAAMGFALFTSGVFFFVGIWLSFVVPHKRKKSLKHCDIVEGQVVDSIKAGRSSSSNNNRRKSRIMYAAIYEYSYGDTVHRYRSTTSSIGHSSVDLGRKVSIAVNNVTGEVFCVEDMKSGALMGIVPMLVGVVGFVIIGCILFL